MTPEEKDKWIALIEGVAAGRQLQYKCENGTWIDAGSLAFVNDVDCYRIEPVEPRSVEAYLHSDAFSAPQNYILSTTQDDAFMRVRVRITEIL